MALEEGLLLDTHVWLWLENKELQFTPSLRQQLEQAARADRIFLCCFSLYEAANAFRKGRVDAKVDPETWFQAAFSGRSVRVLEITPAISLKTGKLPDGFPGDPGDRLIAATAIVENLVLLTHDKALLRFAKQGHLKTINVNQVKKKHAS